MKAWCVFRDSAIMESEMYDEFGNYIGTELESEGESEGDEEAENDMPGLDDEEMADAEEDDVEPEMAVVLHEDKKYYPTAEEVCKID